MFLSTTFSIVHEPVGTVMVDGTSPISPLNTSPSHPPVAELRPTHRARALPHRTERLTIKDSERSLASSSGPREVCDISMHLNCPARSRTTSNSIRCLNGHSRGRATPAPVGGQDPCTIFHYRGPSSSRRTRLDNTRGWESISKTAICPELVSEPEQASITARVEESRAQDCFEGGSESLGEAGRTSTKQRIRSETEPRPRRFTVVWPLANFKFRTP